VRDGVLERLDVVVHDLPRRRPLTLDVFRPADRRGEVLPLVVWIHGGAWRFGSIKSEARFLAKARHGRRVVEAGYALARISYRFSHEATFPAQLFDVKAAVRRLRAASGELGVDPDGFVAWGESAGGHLAALLALTGTPASGWACADPAEAVQAAVCWYAPSNLLTMQRQTSRWSRTNHDSPRSPESSLVGAPVQQVPELSAAASPVTYVSAAAPPMRLVHGERDRLVPCAQSRELYDALVAAGCAAELRLVPGADHCFRRVDLTPLVDDALEFIGRTVGGRSVR
jgi:acetyl esterase/lipase